MIGCSAGCAPSSDPHDSRWRPSLYVGCPISPVLVDTSTDLRAQALRFRVTRVDAILFTHSHADHVIGLDEVRRFNAIQRTRIPCFADARTAWRSGTPSATSSRPHGSGRRAPGDRPVHGGRRVLVWGRVGVTPVPLWHGRRPCSGIRIGAFAYLTDCSARADDSWALLAASMLVVDALRRSRRTPRISLSPRRWAWSIACGPPGRVHPHVHDLPHAATSADCRRRRTRIRWAHSTSEV